MEAVLEIIQLCLIVIALLYALMVFVIGERMPGSTISLIGGSLLLIGSGFHAVGTAGQSEVARIIGVCFNCVGILVFCAGITRYWIQRRELYQRAEKAEQQSRRLKERCLNGT